MPLPEPLTLREARALTLIAQGVGAWPRRPGRAALRCLLLRHGNVQLDSVNAIARTQELVPFSRLGPYRVADLHHVVYRERLMFEYWGHAMSWVPMAEYRYFLPRMERHRTEPRSWWRDVREKYPELYPAVLARIRDEGPLGAADFEHQRERRGSWWDLKPAKLVLEDLFDQGVLMATDRRSGFQRIYDLAERVLPANTDLRRPSDAEVDRHFLLRAARALGVGTLRDLAEYFRIRPTSAKPALLQLLEAGSLVAVSVQGWRETAYSVPELLGGPLRRPRHRPLLLSPFDPLVWERDRLARLFGLDYRIEIYTPEAKRRYGYYVLPLLVGGEMVGRVDARNDRGRRILNVPAVHLEAAVSIQVAPAIATALADLARFLGAERIVVVRTEPPELHEPLRRALGGVDPDLPQEAEVLTGNAKSALPAGSGEFT
jgi:uncharacterized protein YcaQ